jgi:hypothetical protein
MQLIVKMFVLQIGNVIVTVMKGFESAYSMA